MGLRQKNEKYRDDEYAKRDMFKDNSLDCRPVRDVFNVIDRHRRRWNSEEKTWFVVKPPGRDGHVNLRTVHFRNGISFRILLAAERSATELRGLHAMFHVNDPVTAGNFLLDLQSVPGQIVK